MEPDPTSPIDRSSRRGAPGRALSYLLGDDGPLCLLLAAMLLLGIYLRVRQLGLPGIFKWDEHHYVRVARAYLAGQYDNNLHPQLGTLIIAGALRIFGDRPLAWRLAPLVFGFLDVGLVAWVARIVFRSRRAALIAAAFVAADGFFIAYSRTALLDGMIVAFGAAGIGMILEARAGWQVLLAGLLLGCVASIKLNGVTLVAVALVVCLARRRIRWYAPVLALVAAVVFYAQTAFALILMGRRGTVASAIAEHRKLIKEHLSYTVVNPVSSHWYTWFLPWRPIFLRRDVDPVTGSIRALITLGNPLLWWASTAAVVAIAVAVGRVGWRRLWPQLRDAVPAPAPAPPAAPGPVLALGDRAGTLFWMLMAWAAPLAFWVPSLRDAYLYHYLPSYTFALVLLAGLTDRLYARRPLATLIAISLVLEVSLFYAPLWGELPVSEDALNIRLFPFWR